MPGKMSHEVGDVTYADGEIRVVSDSEESLVFAVFSDHFQDFRVYVLWAFLE
jgi:hypothetical protein